MKKDLPVTENEPLRLAAVIGSGLRNKRILNVKETTKKEVQQIWETPLPLLWPDTLYVRCNAKGLVNWEIAPVFRPEELIKRGNYNVIK